MAGFLNRFKGGGIVNSKSDGNAGPKKKEEPSQELTPLEKLLQGAGPVREDGSDKFFGLENFGNTCYCNSILQALYYSEPFRECVLNYPSLDTIHGNPSKVNVSIRAPVQANGQAACGTKDKKGVSNAQALKQRQSLNSGTLGPNGQPLRPEDKPDSPEYKKKQAMIKGPVLELAQDNPEAYGMQECTFTGLKDIFTALVESNSRTGVLSPQRFLDIFKRDNEMFRNSMHQDAHEFYGLVLNDVIANVEANAKRMQEKGIANTDSSLAQSVGSALGTTSHGTPGTGWVHDIFEGVLTSETRCLTCETASQRDETFLDLSIDLEEHSSVTSCLKKFSAEEMLCERNKFHCDHCGGLQEAEKRMKVKKLPKVLALHLKRFKYSDDYTRLAKLFHRVNYPYELRMFNTTDDAEDPDRVYELYAVVVHIGGNAYHGHYVSVIKTKDRGWLLFDDEMVEPVDKMFVRNFFGDKPGQACAYVLFYQETSWDKLREERDAEGLEEVRLASQQADMALGGDQLHATSTTPLSKLNSQPTSGADEEHETLATLNHAKTAPGDLISTQLIPETPVVPAQVETNPTTATTAEKEKAPEPAPATKSKDDIAREKKELKAQEKARKAAEKEQAKFEEKQRLERQTKLREAQKNEQEQLSRALKESKLQQALEEKQKKRKDSSANGGENGEHHKSGFLNRASRGSKSMTKKSFAFLGKGSGDKDKDKSGDKEKDRGGDKSDKSVKSSRSGRSESNAGTVTTTTTATETGPSSSRSQSQGPPQQNGTGAHLPRAATQPTQSQSRSSSQAFEKPPLPATPIEKPPLKERFSFGLGRKKSSRFLS